MSDDFSVKLNGKEYNQNNLPEEIVLNGKTENEDILSVFDKDKDGKLSKSEIKGAILSFANEEKRVSGAFSDGNISDQEAENIAKHFMKGKFNIGENVKKLVNELQNRINKQVEANRRKACCEKLINAGVNPNQAWIEHTREEVYGPKWAQQIVTYKLHVLGKKDGTVVDTDGNIIPDLKCELIKEYEYDGEKCEEYRFYSNSANESDPKKEKAEGPIRRIINTIKGKKD